MRHSGYLWFSIYVFALVSWQNGPGKSAAVRPGDVTHITGNKRKLKIPSELIVYSPFKNYLLDNIQLKKHSSLKIYSYVNVSCPGCIADIDIWNKLAAEFIKKDVPVILVFYSKDNFEYIKHLCEVNEIKKFPFPFYLDNQNKFPIGNPDFEALETSPTVLIDRNNKIILTGNPLHSSKTKELYMAKIKAE